MGGSVIFFGGAGRKIGLNVGKWSFSQGLSRGFFQVVPDISEHSILHIFCLNPLPQISKSTKYSKKLLLDKFQIVPSPSLYFGLCFKILLCLLSGEYRNYVSQNFVFKTYAYSKLSRKNVKGVDLTPTPWYKKVKEGTLKYRIFRNRTSLS